MTDYPAEYVTDDGEVLEGTDALATARREMAAFKFKLFKTINGDPRAHKMAVKVTMALTEFLSVDKRTLKPKTPYMSNPDLEVATCLSRRTVIAVRRNMEKLKYWNEAGKSECGCTKYRIENPHFDYVQMHLHEAKEKRSEEEAVRKADERRKKGGVKYAPPSNDVGCADYTDRGAKYAPNYLRTNLGDYISEGKANTLGANDSQPDQPFPIPSEPEAS
jgi:hypothetical protein